MNTLKDSIINGIKEAAYIRGTDIAVELVDETVLLESGLDSLGFAILVAKLEEELGYDPFALMDEPMYPRTLTEFVTIYQRFKPK